MCGRFASSLPADEMRRLFQIMGELPNVEPSWNIAPSQRAAVVRRHPETDERRLDLLTWGLVPSFTKDLKAARKPINARSETVATSGMFRQALAKRRAIVPADLFYEWRRSRRQAALRDCQGGRAAARLRRVVGGLEEPGG